MRAAERNLDRLQLASLGELSRGLFHDLASPLTAITLVAETLCAAAAKTPDATRVCAEELLFSCNDLRGLVQTIREYIADPRAERGFSLAEAVGHAVRLVRHRGGVAEQQWRLEWDRDRGCFHDRTGLDRTGHAGLAPLSRPVVPLPADRPGSPRGGEAAGFRRAG